MGKKFLHTIPTKAREGAFVSIFVHKIELDTQHRTCHANLDAKLAHFFANMASYIHQTCVDLNEYAKEGFISWVDGWVRGAGSCLGWRYG